MKTTINIFWFRRDLRLQDNAGLYHALKAGIPVLPVFIFDTNILNELPDRCDARVNFIYRSITYIQESLQHFHSSLFVEIGTPEKVFEKLFKQYEVLHVYTNADHELYALERETKIARMAKEQGCRFLSFKDQVVFDGTEITKADGTPYRVFTPFYHKWMKVLRPFHLKAYPTEKYASHFLRWQNKLPTLKAVGFGKSTITLPSCIIPAHTIQEYTLQRDFPYLENGTSRLGIHLRFGTISIRQLVAYAQLHNTTYLRELVWREFYQMVLQCFPRIRENKAFKKEYDFIEWRNNESAFEKWKVGQTGIPFVDAGMRELLATGFMHNRARMVTASFLSKNLLIDWRWGEAWFAEKLLDFDFASNNGGWQWAAGCGCDAAPYFRVFNPFTQAEKFDPEKKYIRKWLPEYGTDRYPVPMVDIKESRELCLAVYKKALQK